MDDRGFIFTVDAALGLIIFMVFVMSFLSYYMLPFYLGQDHQHLEMIADDALDVMFQDGTLYAAAVKYAAGDTEEAEELLRNSLNVLIPQDTAYKLTLGTNTPVSDDRGLLYSKDTTTRVRVISGPREGWIGRAWYKIEEVEYEDQVNNATTTLWNFHNWLTNFNPWNGGLRSNPYWGGGSSPQSISFSIPSGATINGGKFLLGSCNRNNGSSYSANVVVNGFSHMNTTPFTYLNNRPSTNPPERMYNYQGTISPIELNTGTNNFYVNFLNMNSSQTYDMPWFSLIGSYTTTIKVPKGVLSSTFPFNDAAGLAVPDPQDLDGNGVANEYGRIYDLNTGSVSSFTTRRVMLWSDFVSNRNVLDNYDDGVPFVIDNIPGIGDGSAVSVVQDVYIPEGSRIFDGSVVINAYGGVDNALVEVWNGTQWNTAFCSFNFDGTTYSARSDGYGNIPGIITIGGSNSPYLKTGNNKVRITIWDHVPSSDYDLVGLVNCYTAVAYSQLPIKWDIFAYYNYQDNNYDNTYTQNRAFTIGPDAKKVYMFVGTGLDTRSISIQVRNSTSGWITLYNSTTIPYSLDLAALDAGGPHVFTSGTSGNYTIRQGTFNSRVTITSSNGWESGDGGTSPSTYANPELFSGTKIAVLYPKFLQNVWATSYANDPITARNLALDELVASLSGVVPEEEVRSRAKTEALYTGNLPNAIPVRLDLWKH